MGTRFALIAALLAAICTFVVAADSPPLVKPVVPSGNATRVRVPLVANKNARLQFKAAITNPKGKKGDTTAITVRLDSHHSVNGVAVSIQQWKAWGFEVLANRMAVLPELVISSAQLAPKPTKGRDVEYRIPNIKVSLYEAPGGDTGGVNNILEVPVNVLTNGSDRTCEPRVYYADRFLELTVPRTTVKRLDTGAATSPDPQNTDDDTLVPAAAPMIATSGRPVFAFITVNGQSQYILPTKKVLNVVGGVDLGSVVPILMSVSMARGCDVELTDDERTGKVRELRIGMLTGPGYRAQKDLVLRDVTVLINQNEDSSFIWIGSQFADQYLKDGVFGCAPDAVWRLYGRVKPELLEDIRTRKPRKP